MDNELQSSSLTSQEDILISDLPKIHKLTINKLLAELKTIIRQCLFIFKTQHITQLVYLINYIILTQPQQPLYFQINYISQLAVITIIDSIVQQQTNNQPNQLTNNQPNQSTIIITTILIITINLIINLILQPNLIYNWMIIRQLLYLPTQLLCQLIINHQSNLYYYNIVGIIVINTISILSCYPSTIQSAITNLILSDIINMFSLLHHLNLQPYFKPIIQYILNIYNNINTDHDQPIYNILYLLVQNIDNNLIMIWTFKLTQPQQLHFNNLYCILTVINIQKQILINAIQIRGYSNIRNGCVNRFKLNYYLGLLINLVSVLMAIQTLNIYINWYQPDSQTIQIIQLFKLTTLFQSWSQYHQSIYIMLCQQFHPSVLLYCVVHLVLIPFDPSIVYQILPITYFIAAIYYHLLILAINWNTIILRLRVLNNHQSMINLQMKHRLLCLLCLSLNPVV